MSKPAILSWPSSWCRSHCIVDHCAWSLPEPATTTSRSLGPEAYHRVELITGLRECRGARVLCPFGKKNRGACGRQRSRREYRLNPLATDETFSQGACLRGKRRWSCRQLSSRRTRWKTDI